MGKPVKNISTHIPTVKVGFINDQSSNQQEKCFELKVHPPGDVGGSHHAPPTFAKEGKYKCVLNCEYRA